MRNGEKRPTQRQILVSAFVLALAMLLSNMFLPKIFEAITPTPNLNIENSPEEPGLVSTVTPLTATLEIDITQTLEAVATPTMRYFPEPIIGATGENLPHSFKVGQWHDNSCDFNFLTNSVDIYGVDIGGGTPPYEIAFWEKGMKIIDRNITPTDGIAQFVPPVEVKRGAYIQVTIAFYTKNEKSEWIDDLKYPNNQLCANP